METAMDITRRDFVRLTTLAATASGFGLAMAQEPLLDQVRILVGFPPGGGTDTAARRIADGVRGSYARMTLVENKPGASARLVVEDIRRGPADGSLLLVQPDAVMTQQPHVDPKNTRYKYEDLTPVASIVQISHALAVGPMVPESVRNMQDFLAWAKGHPDRANYGSPGGNSSQDFLMKAAMKHHGFELTHVPYRGSAPGISDLIAGQVAAMISPVGDSLPHLTTGKLRIVGTSGAQRSKFAPEVPTFKEQGFQGMELSERFGVWTKAGVPELTQDRLHAAVQKVLVQPDVIEFFSKVGMEVNPISRQAFVKASRDSYDAWAERVRVTGFKPE